MTSSALIVDGYVDEPACLGVSPYISPYVREVAGVLSEHGYDPGYVTIDQVRSDPALVGGRGDLVVMIAGVTVPGTYVGEACDPHGDPAARDPAPGTDHRHRRADRVWLCIRGWEKSRQAGDRRV